MNDLIIVAREPRPGAAKTRLIPALGASGAAALAEAMLLDTLDLARAVPGCRRLLAFTPAGAETHFAKLAPDFECFPQQGADLGRRLAHALGRSFEAGAGRAAIMDSDSPTLPISALAAAFAALDEADVALGPTADGGYYLIALKRPAPRLLTGVRMSTARTAADTLALAAALSLTCQLLPQGYDVDTRADVERLRRELDENLAVAPHTRAALAGLELL